MCTHKYYVRNKYTHERVLVNCGHCPACLQAKADKMKNRISLQAVQDVRNGKLQLFVTLGYKHGTCPYVFASDIAASDVGVPSELSVYRDTKYSRSFGSCFLVRQQEKLKKSRIIVNNFGKLHYDYINSFHLCEQAGSGKIGVVYYNDVQNFQKRFLSFMRRHSDCPKSAVKFFCASELGPTTFRPHFHLLVTVPQELYQVAVRAVCSAWPYANWNTKRREKCIQVARDAASYVASYVNSPSNLPLFLETVSPTSHSHSKFYGYDSQYFAFPKILEMLDKKSFRLPIFFDKSRNSMSNKLIPTYVLGRYFPLFKGISRLSDYEIRDVLQCPKRLLRYAEKCEYSQDDINNISANLRRALARTALDVTTWSVMWFDAWRVYKQNILSDWYNEQVLNPIPTNYYDNLNQLERSSARMSAYGLSNEMVVPPNLQSSNVSYSNYLTRKYRKKQKQRKANSVLYNDD